MSSMIWPWGDCARKWIKVRSQDYEANNEFSDLLNLFEKLGIIVGEHGKAKDWSERNANGNANGNAFESWP